MLPDSIYKSLPYLYIFTGLFFAFVIESEIVLLSSFLLLASGFLVLWMRRNARDLQPRVATRAHENSVSHEYIYRSDEDRRSAGTAQVFPLIDDSGGMVAFERRVGERRQAMA